MSVHPLAHAIAPLLERVGGTAVPVDQREPGDVVLHWEGAPAIAVDQESLIIEGDAAAA